MSRTKDQWLENTGGFRIGESPEQFEKRVEEIARIRTAIKDGKAGAADVEKLASLLGTDESDD